MNLYVLDEDGQTPVAWSDMAAVARWQKEHPPTEPPVAVAQDTVGDAEISTVFLSHDHNYTGHGPPVLWETMVFGGDHDGSCWRYTSHSTAVEGHDRVVAALRDGREPGYDFEEAP